MLNTPQSFLAPAAAGLLALQTACAQQKMDTAYKGYEEYPPEEEVDDTQREPDEYVQCYIEETGEIIAAVMPGICSTEHTGNGGYICLTTLNWVDTVDIELDTPNGKAVCKDAFLQNTGGPYYSLSMWFADEDMPTHMNARNTIGGHEGICYGDSPSVTRTWAYSNAVDPTDPRCDRGFYEVYFN